jgi:profilin
MSWQDYVNGYLVNWVDTNQDNKTYKNVCEHGALVGNGDGTVWAKTDNFSFGVFKVQVEKDDGSGQVTVDVDEFANLKDAFENEGTTKRQGGLRINNEKYFMVSFDKDRNVMYLKKNGGGACVARSGLAYVIGTFNSSMKCNVAGKDIPQSPGNTNLVCEKLQEFLTTNNL